MNAQLSLPMAEQKRRRTQLDYVYEAMQQGGWWTFEELREHLQMRGIYASEAGISAATDVPCFTGADVCWLWTGAVNNMGYAVMGVGCAVYFAHRIAYELTVGPIAAGMELDHKCRVTCCVNPRHLEPVSHLENVRRGTAPAATRAYYASRSRCVNGHELTPDNTYHYRKNGYAARACKTCRRIRNIKSGGAMTAATTAAGGGGGTGGGGGGTCVMAGTSIEPVGESPYSVGVHPQNDWVRIEAGLYSLNCTPNHPLYAEHCGRIQARDVVTGMELLCSDGVRKVTNRDVFQRACTKRSVHLEAGHLYWANGFLSHNSKLA